MEGVHIERAHVRQSKADATEDFSRIGLLPYTDMNAASALSHYDHRLSTAELLALPDVDAFVTGAYWTVLRRSPDPSGWETYRNLLLAKTHTRLDVICILRDSPEGQALKDRACAEQPFDGR